MQSANVDRRFVIGKETIVFVPELPHDIRNRSSVWLHEAEIAAGFKHSMNLSHGFADVRMNMMETANYDDTIKRVASEARIEQRTACRLAILPPRSETCDGFG